MRILSLALLLVLCGTSSGWAADPLPRHRGNLLGKFKVWSALSKRLLFDRKVRAVNYKVFGFKRQLMAVRDSFKPIFRSSPSQLKQLSTAIKQARRLPLNVNASFAEVRINGPVEGLISPTKGVKLY